MHLHHLLFPYAGEKASFACLGIMANEEIKKCLSSILYAFFCNLKVVEKGQQNTMNLIVANTENQDLHDIAQEHQDTRT